MRKRLSLSILKETKRKQMKNCSIHLLVQGSAKQAGFMPTSWYADLSYSNDRTPEICQGSRRTVV